MRFWLAEHHNMPGIASAATAVVIGACGGGNLDDPGRRRRDHAAEPRAADGRRGVRDAGDALSRADRPRARAARRAPTWRRRGRCGATCDGGDSFPQDVLELIGYFEPTPARGSGARHPRRGHARAGLDPRLEPLRRAARGASGAALRLRLAFRAGRRSSEAIAVYRETFRPSQHLAEPHVMLALNVFAAETDAEGRRLRTSMQQAFANLRTGPARAAAAAGRRHRGAARPGGAARWSTRRSPARRPGRRRRCGASSAASSSATAPDEVMPAFQPVHARARAGADPLDRVRTGQ